MKTAELGKTGEGISRIGPGCMLMEAININLSDEQGTLLNQN
jgi:hypothetical protein